MSTHSQSLLQSFVGWGILSQLSQQGKGSTEKLGPWGVGGGEGESLSTKQDFCAPPPSPASGPVLPLRSHHSVPLLFEVGSNHPLPFYQAGYP